MIIKCLGMAFVLAATALAGLYYGSLDAFRQTDLVELKKALAILRAEIEFARSPLGEALLNIGRRTSKQIGVMFLRLEELLHVERDEDIALLWARCVEENAGKTYLNREDREQLLSFGKTLGYLDAGMQLSNISLLTDYINTRIEALNTSRHKNRRMFQSLGILAGMLIIIIFI